MVQVGRGRNVAFGCGSLSLQSSLGANSTFDMSGETARRSARCRASPGPWSDLGAGTLTVNETTSGTFAGTIQDGGAAGGSGGSLTLGGLGELSLTRASGTTIDGGTLVYDPPATTKHAPAAKIDTRWIEAALADFGGVTGDWHAHAPMHDPFGRGVVSAFEHHERFDKVVRGA